MVLKLKSMHFYFVNFNDSEHIAGNDLFVQVKNDFFKLFLKPLLGSKISLKTNFIWGGKLKIMWVLFLSKHFL